jgi:hypothetical protein
VPRRGARAHASHPGQGHRVRPGPQGTRRSPAPTRASTPLTRAQLSIVVEFIAGKVTDTIDRLTALYRPDALVVGTRGQKSMIQSWGAAFGGASFGSVSKYCLSRSPVPIIVVRPEAKVRKTLDKRRADPKRGKHFDEWVSAPAAGRVAR